MKSISILPLILLLCLFAGHVRSQAPGVTGTVLTNLQGVQASNKTLLERQQKTLDLLDQLLQTCDQLRTFTKRG